MCCCLGTMVNLPLQQNFCSQTAPSFMLSLCVLLLPYFFLHRRDDRSDPSDIFSKTVTMLKCSHVENWLLTVAKLERHIVHANQACCRYRFLSHKVLLCKTSYYVLHLQDFCREGKHFNRNSGKLLKLPLLRQCYHIANIVGVFGLSATE